MAQVTGHGEHQVYVTINWPDQHITEIRRWNGLDDFTQQFNTTPTRETVLGTSEQSLLAKRLDIGYSMSILATDQSFEKAH